MLVLGIVGLPIPDESVLAFAGYLVYKGKLQLFPSLVAATIGSVCGITLSYALGCVLGIVVVERYGRFFGITRPKLDLVHAWFRRIGKWTLVFGYYVPGVRHLTAFVAGSSKLEWVVFAPFAYAGGFIWSMTFLSLGYFLGKNFSRVFATLHQNLLMALGLVLVVFLTLLLVQQRRRGT